MNTIFSKKILAVSLIVIFLVAFTAITVSAAVYCTSSGCNALVTQNHGAVEGNTGTHMHGGPTGNSYKCYYTINKHRTSGFCFNNHTQTDQFNTFITAHNVACIVLTPGALPDTPCGYPDQLCMYTSFH